MDGEVCGLNSSKRPGKQLATASKLAQLAHDDCHREGSLTLGRLLTCPVDYRNLLQGYDV